MEYRFVIVPFLLTILSTLTTGLPLSPDGDQAKETVAVYIPYDVKYVPVEIPDKFLNVEPLNSRNPVVQDSIVLKKVDVLKYINHDSENTAIEPVATIKASSERQVNKEELVVVPLSTLSDSLKPVKVAEPKGDLIALALTKDEQENDLDTRRVPIPLRAKRNVEFYVEDNENSFAQKPHKLSKRQAQRRPFYRPVFRFSQLSRRRVRGPSRNPALVGYLNDRDYFPTLA